ncbi:MAG: DNA polymerase/3'-5' exonuclease PolX [bacterium]
MENIEIARLLDVFADVLEIQGENPFRVRAYRNAARTVRGHGAPMRKLLAEGADLTQLAGIGKEMASHIRALVETGKLAQLEAALEAVPPQVLDLMRIPGLGPKRAKQLWEELGVASVDELQRAVEEGRLAGLKGYGAKIRQNILEGIAAFRSQGSRFKLCDADQYVIPLVEHMRRAPGVERVEVAGSYRRRRETVGDIDILVIAQDMGPVMKHFTAYGGVARVQSAGGTRGSVLLTSGLQVDLRILSRESFGAALAYFTGSKEHNIRLRRIGIERGLRISEYGVFRVEAEAKRGRSREEVEGKEALDRDPMAGELVAGREEADVYKAVGLPWIPPELREDRGEIEAARQGTLPRLLQPTDIKGDLQVHSTWSDGENTIEQMLDACLARKYEYLAITDHSKAVTIARGLNGKRLREQWQAIDEVASRRGEIRILKGMEVDILADGSLDLEDELIEELDLVVVAIHSKFNLPAVQQTERILKGLRHPRVHLFAHPTCRIINQRKPIEFDLDEVLTAAAELGVAVELNASPDRLDLMDAHVLQARKKGVRIAIDTDAHRIEDLGLIRYGVEQARRAWLGKEHVLNALPLDKLLKALRP